MCVTVVEDLARSSERLAQMRPLSLRASLQQVLVIYHPIIALKSSRNDNAEVQRNKMPPSIYWWKSDYPKTWCQWGTVKPDLPFLKPFSSPMSRKLSYQSSPHHSCTISMPWKEIKGHQTRPLKATPGGLIRIPANLTIAMTEPQYLSILFSSQPYYTKLAGEFSPRGGHDMDAATR